MALARALAISFGLACLVWGSASEAQTLSVIEDLEFGRLIATQDVPGQVTVDQLGDVTSSSHILHITQARPAVFLVEGATPGQSLSIIATASSQLGGPSQHLTKPTVSGLDYPAAVTADTVGEVTFAVGATLNLAGATPASMNETYIGTLTVTVTP